MKLVFLLDTFLMYSLTKIIFGKKYAEPLVPDGEVDPVVYIVDTYYMFVRILVGVIDWAVVVVEEVHPGDHDDHQKDLTGKRDEMPVSSYQTDQDSHSLDMHNFDLAVVQLKVPFLSL